jgi:hypothetical protein
VSQRGSRVMSGDWQRLHRVHGVSGGSPENYWVPWLIHKAKTSLIASWWDLVRGKDDRAAAWPCMKLFGMYRWFGVVPQGLDVLFPFVLFGDLWALFLAISLERFRGLSLWDLVGDICWALRGSFPFDSPPKSVSILGGISSGFPVL